MAEAIGGLYDRDCLALPRERLERALEDLLHPAVVFVPESSSGVRHVGIAEIVRLLVAARGDWTSCRYAVEQVDEEHDEVLVSGRVLAEARGSGARASFPFAHVWAVRDQRVVKIAAYHSLADAREALADCVGV